VTPRTTQMTRQLVVKQAHAEIMVCICIYVYTDVCSAYMYMRIHVLLYMYICIYICIYMHDSTCNADDSAVSGEASTLGDHGVHMYICI